MCYFKYIQEIKGQKWWHFKWKCAATHFLPPLSSLKDPLAPKSKQRCSQSCSQRQLDGGDSVAQIGVAAVPDDGVVNVQDGLIRHIFAGICRYAAFIIDWQPVGSKCWKQERWDMVCLVWLFQWPQLIMISNWEHRRSWAPLCVWEFREVDDLKKVYTEVFLRWSWSLWIWLFCYIYNLNSSST